jgi:hypothetical protein
MNSHELTVEVLTAELYAMGETPTEEFAAALDARAAAGFPGRRRWETAPARVPGGEVARLLTERLRGASPRRALMPALAGAATVIVIATAVVVSTDGNDGGDGPATVTALSGESNAAPAQSKAGSAGAGAGAALSERRLSGNRVGETAVAPPAGGILPKLDLPGNRGAPGIGNRQVERSANLALATEPEQVQDVAGKVIDVVGRYRGIVLSSSVRDGGEGEAGATFDLLIPSGRLSGALTDLSGLAEVRSRSENTLDITAPFVSAREHLRDVRAEAEGLLRQLAEADTDTERASVKAQLQIVRGRIAAFRSKVNGLERRANFSRVSLQIVTGEGAVIPGAGGGSWTIGDALHDAGRVLAIAAGVALIALALSLPLALLGGGAWAGRRIYLRRARDQALGT